MLSFHTETHLNLKAFETGRGYKNLLKVNLVLLPAVMLSPVLGAEPLALEALIF